MSINRSKMKRQMYQAGGLGALRPQQQTIYPRLDSLQNNVSSAEQQLQEITQSIDQVQSTLGTPSNNDMSINPVSGQPDAFKIDHYAMAQSQMQPNAIPVAQKPENHMFLGRPVLNQTSQLSQLNSSPMMNTVDRRKFGFGDFVGDILGGAKEAVEDVASKIVPKEIAGPLMMAAPFLGPVYGPLAYAAGSAKRTGRIDPLKLALIAAPYVQFQGGEGLGAFKPVGYGGSKYGIFGGDTIGIGDMEGISAAEKASELFEKDFEFLGKGDETASIKDVLGDVVTSPEFIVGGGLSLVQYIEAKKQEKENEGLEFSQEDYDNAVNDYYKQYSESFKKGFKTGGVVSKRKKFKGGMSDNRVTQLLTLREEAMENGDDDKVQEIDQELGLIFKQYKTGGRVGLKDGTGDETIYMTEDGKEVDTGEGQFLTMEEAKEKDPAMFMDTTTYNPIPEDAPEQAANEIARIMLGISDLPREEGEVESDTMSSTEFMYNEYLIPKRKELMENFGLSMPEADDLIRNKMMEIRSQNADGGSIKGIGQLAKPKGNKRQGFRGEGGYQGGRDDTPAGAAPGGGVDRPGGGGGDNRREQYAVARTTTPKNISALANVPSGNQLKTETKLNKFMRTRPEVNIPTIPTPLNLGLQLFQKPIQKFADFTTAKNRNFFASDNLRTNILGYDLGSRKSVIEAGRYNLPGQLGEKYGTLDIGDVSKMSNEELEQAYQSYMDDRLSGKIDAYGNPKDVDRGGSDNKYIPPVATGATKVAEQAETTDGSLYEKYKESLSRGFAKEGGISQLAKPKGNKRQGFRGDDAYGGGGGGRGGRGGGGNRGGDGGGPSARDRAMGSGGKQRGGTNTRSGGGGNQKAPPTPSYMDLIRNVTNISNIPAFNKLGRLEKQYGFGRTGLPSQARHMAGMNILSNTIGAPFSKVSPALGTFVGDLGALGVGTITEIGDLFSRGFNKQNISEVKEDLIDNVKGTFGTPNTLTSEQIYSNVYNRPGAKDGGLKKVPVRTSKIGVKELDYRQDGGFVPLGVKERADDVPAMLSKNEFVFTADAVRGAGNGNINKGARKMYDLMNKLEARKV